MKVSCYENIKKPKVKSLIEIEDFINKVKNGDDQILLINKAREYGKGHDTYNSIKTNLLPTYRFNFLFNQSASNKNITEPTGLIYIDIDKDINMNHNNYIFAKWKSLSNLGYGVLVRVENLTLNNFKEVYQEISNLLNVETDIHAAKATQQTVLSYDPDIYYNSNSLVYAYKETKKVSSHTIKKEEKCMGRNDTFLNTSNTKYRFNNIDDYFKENLSLPYIIFQDEKVKVCDPFVPFRVEKGKRNTTMYYCLSQYAMLNNHVSYQFLINCAKTFNSNMYPRLEEKELGAIVNSILKKKKENSLEIYYNKERRILFNPSIKMTRKEKMLVVNKELGKLKSDVTESIIYELIEDWDFNKKGKIIQHKVAEELDISTSTVKRYWKSFKGYVKDLNQEYRQEQSKVKEGQPKLTFINRYLPSKDLVFSLINELSLDKRQTIEKSLINQYFISSNLQILNKSA